MSYHACSVRPGFFLRAPVETIMFSRKDRHTDQSVRGLPCQQATPLKRNTAEPTTCSLLCFTFQAPQHIIVNWKHTKINPSRCRVTSDRNGNDDSAVSDVLSSSYRQGVCCKQCVFLWPISKVEFE